MAKKETKVGVMVYVFWILVAMIGAAMLFAGIRNSVENSIFQENIVTSLILVITGLIFLFIGLIMVIGRANIEAQDLEMPKKKNEVKKAKA